MKSVWLTLAILLAAPHWLAGEAAPAFSDLPRDRQQSLRAAAEPPPPADRRGPYSLPMYYLMYKGYTYDGAEDHDPNGRCYPKLKGQTGPDFGRWSLDRNRPDWQEAMIRNWAELGCNSTHLNIYPVNKQLVLDPDHAQAIADFARLSGKYGLRVGVRLDALDETKLWSVHPSNPQSVRSQYLGWVEQVAALLCGQTAYYVLGDELTLHAPAAGLPVEAWTADQYLEYFRVVAAAIRKADPAARVCMFAASSGEWDNVLKLLQTGYREAGDGVAINHYDYNTVSRFFADRDRLAPGKLFLTSGVGYVSLGTVSPRYPEGDPYSPASSEEEHAARIARTMFKWWDLGADTAPYYISLRNWEVDGRVYPRWYGFFGFEDFVVKGDQLTVRRHAGWYAYQAVASTFYNRDELQPLEMEVSPAVTVARGFVRQSSAGRQALVMLWNDGEPVDATFSVAGSTFGRPVRLSLSDFRRWDDVPAERDRGQTRVRLRVGSEPVILRLFED